MQDLFNMDENTGMDFLVKKTVSSDGIYRPNLKNVKDKKKGYRTVVRFLPNFTKEGTLGKNAIEKVQHYVKLPSYQELNGYYDSMKNFEGEKCELTNTFWALKNSKSVVEQEKAQLIARSVKYYSYVQIIEDENQPELVGKIMIFSFGHKIKEKIAAEQKGEISGTPCNVYDIANGKDFVLIVKEVGGFPNYDSSTFKPETSALKLFKNGVGKEVPTVDNNGKKSINAQFHASIKEYLSKRDKDLEDFSAKRWTEEERGKVAKIVAILTDNPIVNANNSISKTSTEDFTSSTFTASESVSAPKSKSADVDPDDFFDDL